MMDRILTWDRVGLTFFFSSNRRHTRFDCDWSSDVCSSDLEDGTDPKLINMAEFLVDLKPENEWQRGVDKPKLLREMDAEVNKIPGITPSFSQPIRDNVLESDRKASCRERV